MGGELRDHFLLLGLKPAHTGRGDRLFVCCNVDCQLSLTPAILQVQTESVIAYSIFQGENSNLSFSNSSKMQV